VKGILARTETLPVHLVVARGAGRRGRFLYSSSGHRVSAKGLTHRMREAFFPDYDYEKGDRHRAWIEADGSIEPDTAGLHSRGPPRTPAMAQAQGNKLDTQLAAIVNGGRKPGSRTMPAVRGVMDWFATCTTWRPERAQVCIAAPAIGVATAIDMVLTAETTAGERLIVIDTKLGYVNHMTRASGLMAADSPLAKCPNHPLNQHRLQLALTIGMLGDGGYVQPDDPVDACVVQASETGQVVPYPLPAWWRERIPAIWEHFAKFCVSHK